MLTFVTPDPGETPSEAQARDLAVVQRLCAAGDAVGFARCYVFGVLRAQGVTRAEAERRVCEEIV
jgi:hypothetical protein